MASEGYERAVLTNVPSVGSERECGGSGCSRSLPFGESAIPHFWIESDGGASSDSLNTSFDIVLQDSGDGSEFPVEQQRQ